MAACQSCNREMLAASSCRTRLGAVRYGSEHFRPDPLPDHCRDCGVAVGGVHHALCCVQECGRCGGQRLTCPHGQEDRHIAAYITDLARQAESEHEA